jgi:4'-phosphopantetheinyl transferase
LDVPPDALASYQKLLSEDERDRAARFHFELHRNQFIYCRGLLRQKIAQYLKLDPAKLVFSYNKYGKPFFGLESHGAAFKFNLAHSHGFALLAFSLHAEIGVDLEKHRPDYATDEIAERFFAPEEVAVLKSIPSDSRSAAFFDCWTRKEAFLKAHGRGLGLGLDNFIVEFAPGRNAALLKTRFGPDDEALRWAMHALPMPPNFSAALVVEGEARPMKLWRDEVKS